MEIAYLADYPELTPVLAAWFYAQWGHQRPGNSVEKVAAKLRMRLNRDQIPLTMVAMSEGVLLGTASLQGQDLEEREDLSPWLAGVYVDADRRDKGVGSLLVEAIAGQAVRLGVERLFLYTYDRENFYSRLGWFVLERREHDGKQIVVMYKSCTRH